MAYIEILSPNKHYKGFKKNIIVLHTNEPGPYAPGKFPGTAESLGLYLKDPSRQASYQLIVDRNGDVCRSVRDTDCAWAAGPIANNEGLHICVNGWAAQSRAEWLQYDKQLNQTAVEIARWCKQEGIPAKKLTPAMFKAAEWGIGGHGDVALAWRETDHTDPGANYPYDVLIQKVLAILNPAPPAGNAGNGAAKMSDEMIQFMGPSGDGWIELAPQKDPEGKSFSIFKFLQGKEPNVKKQTVVEAIATLIFEATLRIRPYRGKDADRVPETVLGHAATAAGTGLDNRELLLQVLLNQQAIAEKVGVALPDITLQGQPVPGELLGEPARKE